MGSRGAFIDVDSRNFNFVDGGQKYKALGTLSNNDNVKVLIQESGAVKAPEYSHTAERIYAIVQNGKLKHLAYYDENHNQVRTVDLLHPHGPDKKMPHVHLNLNHNDDGYDPSSEDIILINQIKKEYHLK